MILFSRLSFADVLCWGKNALFWKSFWSSGKLKISNVLLPFELPYKKIPEIFIFWTEIIQSSWCFKAWEQKYLEEKKITFNICIYWEEDFSALEMQASLCPLSVFHLTFFWGGHLKIFPSDVSTIIILGYNDLMCASKAGFRYSLSPGWLCPEQDHTISGLQQQLQCVEKRQNEDIPWKELVSRLRHPFCARTGRQCLGGRELTLIYRAL